MVEIAIVMPNGEHLPVVSQLQNKPYNEANLKSILRALKLTSTANVKQAINNMWHLDLWKFEKKLFHENIFFFFSYLEPYKIPIINFYLLIKHNQQSVIL